MPPSVPLTPPPALAPTTPVVGRVTAVRLTRRGRLARLKVEGTTGWYHFSSAVPDAVRQQALRPDQHVTLALNSLRLIVELTVDGYGPGGPPRGLGNEDAGPLRVTHQRKPRSRQRY